MGRAILARQTQETLAKYDHALLRRAAAFLYLKETQSSFEVEREKPSPKRTQRFADLLPEAETNTPLSEERFVELQSSVVDPRFREASYRARQNWVGDDLGFRKRIAFVPPRPNDARALMDGLVMMSEALRRAPSNLDPVVAACISGFTPKGIVLPVSAVILANLDTYVAALEAFSKLVNACTSWNPDAPDVPPTGNDPVYFRYFDATAQTEFLCWALQRTIEHDLDQENSFLLGFDKASRALGGEMDWPAHSLSLFIRVVRENGFKLSKNKRAAHFSWMTDEEVAKSERVVEESFARISAAG